MRTKKTAGARIFAAAVTAALLLSGCNDFDTTGETPPGADTVIQANQTIKGIDAKECDMAHIRKIRMYNWCCDSGWANQACTFTLYSTMQENGYKANAKYRDIFLSDLPIENFGIDAWGNSIVWTDSDAGNYSGSPKDLEMSSNLNLEVYRESSESYRLVESYSLADVTVVNGGGIQMCFVDKDGNESAYFTYLKGEKDSE